MLLSNCRQNSTYLTGSLLRLMQRWQITNEFVCGFWNIAWNTVVNFSQPNKFWSSWHSHVEECLSCCRVCRTALMTRLRQLIHRTPFTKASFQERKFFILRRCLEIQSLRWFLGDVFSASVKLKRVGPRYRTLWTSNTGRKKWPCHKRGQSEKESFVCVCFCFVLFFSLKKKKRKYDLLHLLGLIVWG